MLPPGGSIRGRSTSDLPLGCLEGGHLEGEEDGAGAGEPDFDGFGAVPDPHVRREALHIPAVEEVRAEVEVNRVDDARLGHQVGGRQRAHQECRPVRQPRAL